MPGFRQPTRLAVVLFVAALPTLAALVGQTGTPARAATVYVVTSTSTSSLCPGGSGGPSYTLRCALAAVKAANSAATVQFNIPTTDPGCAGTPVVCTISPTTALPTLSVAGTTIDGYSEPGAMPNSAAFGLADNARILIRLDGTAAGKGYSGLTVTGANVTVQGLALTGWIPNKALGNDGVGVLVTGTAAQGDTVRGNFIGLNPDGLTAAGNDVGVSELKGASGLTVGGISPSDRNIIGASLEGGVLLNVGRLNLVQGNYIGTNAAGTAALPNNDGIDIFAQGTPGGAGTGATIGGTVASAGNVISGNVRYGIAAGLNGVTADAYTVITANLIGVTASGKARLGNTRGIVLDGAKYSTVGGTGPQANVVAGNSSDGIAMGDGDVANVVANNFIGTNASGANLGNGGNGVLIVPVSLSDAVMNNTIAYNALPAVQMGTFATDNVHAAITQNSMFSNLAGISLAGQSPADCLSGPTTGTPNNYTPCPLVKVATTDRIVGEACSGCTVEVYIAPSKTDDEGRTLLGSVTVTCGSPCTGMGDWTLPSTAYSIALAKGKVVTATATASSSPLQTSGFSRAVPVGRRLVVNTTADAPNPCPSSALSLRCAISQVNTDGSGDSIEFNIPSSDSGCAGSPVVCTIVPTSPLPHLVASGVLIDGYTQPGASANTNGLATGDNAVVTVRIDGTQAGAAADGLFLSGTYQGVQGLSVVNFRGASAGSGIHIFGAAAANDRVQGNFIGVDVNGVTAAANTNGVLVGNGALTNTIGGRTLGDANVISGNLRYGVELSQGSGNAVLENAVGTTASGTVRLGNGYAGVFLYGTSGNTIGGPWPASGNVISGNASDGLDGVNATSNTISQNIVGATANGVQALGNGFEGIYLYAGGSNTIGSSVSTQRNIIGGNVGDGVALLGETGDVVTGNKIGMAANNGGLANGGVGVLVGDQASSPSAANQAYLPTPQPDSAGANPSTATISLNTIANNKSFGVQVGQSVYETAVHAVISQNSMKLNAGPGIYLAGSSTSCESNQPSPGPNDLLPCPTISPNTTKTQITGSACVGCVVEVFKTNTQADDLGHGEGLTYLGSTVQGAGIPYWTLNLPYGALSNGDTITTTATLPGDASSPGETSQFSANFTFPNPT